MKAKYFFFSRNISDVFFFKPKNTITINLWHDSPLKKVGFDSPVEQKWIKRKKNLFRKLPYEQWDFLIVASKFWKPIFKSATKIGEEKISATGLPRNDIFWLYKDDGNFVNSLKTNLIKSLNIGFYPSKIIMYAPTFRDGNELKHRFSFEVKRFINNLNEFLKKENLLLLLKFHPLDINVLGKENLMSENTVILTDDYYIQELMLITDILITDYSSLIFDFIILDKPLILYWFDYKSYKKLRGGFYNIEVEKYIPTAYKYGELMHYLKVFLFKDIKPKYSSLAGLFNEKCCASERIIKILEEKTS